MDTLNDNKAHELELLSIVFGDWECKVFVLCGGDIDYLQ